MKGQTNEMKLYMQKMHKFKGQNLINVGLELNVGDVNQTAECLQS